MIFFIKCKFPQVKFPKCAISPIGIPQVQFPQVEFPKCGISQMWNFPNVQFPKCAISQMWNFLYVIGNSGCN